MVQYEKSVADQIVPAAEAFAQGLEKYMRPHHDFQVAMQKAVGSNPELAQQLADLEYKAPGTMDRMGFGDLGKVIAQIPESEKSQFMRQNRGDIMKGEKASLQLKTEQTGFDLGRLHDTIDLLSKPGNEAITADVVLKSLGLPTRAAQKIQDSEVIIKGAEAGVAGKKAEAEGAKADEDVAGARVGRKAYEDALKNLPALKNTDFLGLARDFVSGKQVDGAVMSSIMNTPGSKEVFSKAIQSVEEERQLALRESIASMHAGKDNKEAMLTREAFSRYQSTKGAGTLDAWKTIIGNPHKVEEIKKKNPNDLTQDERDILHADAAQVRLQDAQHIGEIRMINTGVQSAVAAIDKAAAGGKGISEVQTYVDNLNNILKEKADATGKTIVAKYGPRPPIGESDPGHNVLSGRGSGLYYVGEDGKRIKDDEVFAEGKTGLGKLTSDALRAYTEIQAVPQAQRAAALANLKKANPKLYNEVSAVIK